MRRSLTLIIATGALFALQACRPLGTVEQGGPGSIPVEPTPFRDAIPASYGRAFAVTTNPESPSLVYIWFERDDQSVVAVRLEDNEVVEAATIVRR